MRRRSFHRVDEAQDVAGGKAPQPRPQRLAAGRRLVQRLDQTIERAILAEKEELLFAAEIVIEVGRREIGGDRDLAHSGGGEAALAEDPRGGAQDVEAAPLRPAANAGRAAGLGAVVRTTVRKLNHGSIVAGSAA